MPRTKPRKRSWPRWLLAIAAVLLVLYAIAGFLVLPWWLQQQLPEQAQRHLGWDVASSGISANPFSLSVTLDQFQATDSGGETVATVQKLHLDLSFFRFFAGQVKIDELYVQQPYLRLEIDEDNRLNLVEDWRNHSPLMNKSPDADNGGDDAGGDGDGRDGFPLLIDLAAVEGGEILLRDRRSSESRPESSPDSPPNSNPGVREFTISPLKFDLSGVATYEDSGDAGRYQLVATLGDDQDLRWRGEVELLPFSSSGVVELHNIQADSLWHFIGRHAAYDWRKGRLDLTIGYRVDTNPEFQLALDSGQLKLHDSELFLKQDSDGDPALSIARLDAKAIRFDWPQARLQVGNIVIDEWTLAVARTDAGEIDWAAALPRDENADGELDSSEVSGKGSAAERPFSWTVQHLGLTQGTLRWRDSSLEDTAELGLGDIEAEFNGLTGDPDQPVSVSLRVTDGQDGQGRLNGEFTVIPFTLESSLQLSDIALTQFQPYLGDALKLTLESGTAGFDGSISLDDQQPELTGSIEGNLTVDNLATRLSELDEPLVSWQSLRLQPVQVNLKPVAVDISTVTLMGAELTYLRLPDGDHSFAYLLKDDESGTEDEGDDNGDSGDETTPAVRIERASLEDATLLIEDRAIEGGFSTRIHQLGGDIVGLSNRKPQRAQVSLQGQADEQGSLRIEGEIGALGQNDSSELKLVGKNLALEPLTPYFARFLGYKVARGTLELEMDYTLEEDDLEGSNDILMQNFALGESVNSPDAVDAPVKLGISLLRGPDGNIDIDLPVSGDLADPTFSFSDVILSAFTSLVGRVATAPFSAIAGLANLADASGEELGKVGFLPGTDELAPTEPDKLKTLADALKERSGITLRYHGATAPDWDRPALVLAAEGYTLPAADLEAQIRSMENRLSAVQGNSALEQLIESFEGDAGERRNSSEWAQQLLNRLANQRTPESGALRELAEDRATALRNALVDDSGIDGSQLSVDDTRNDAAVEEGRVIVPFDIGSAE